MNIKKKLKYKIGILLLSGIILSVLVLTAFAAKSKKEAADKRTENILDQVNKASIEEESPSFTGTQMTEDKSETVYAKADAEGVIDEITVEAVLKQEREGKAIRDVSELEEIKNTQGEEEYRKEAGNVIVWENQGMDIHYKGKSGSRLPVEVKIHYFLDDKPVSPHELAGQSGRVKIRFDYENHTSEGEDFVPFMVMSACVLPEEVFSNIEVENGKRLVLDGQSMVIGYAWPGLKEELKLWEYEPTEETEIPDYVEITADAAKFELDFTATVVTTGTFSDLDTEDLNDVQELVDSMEELTDASKELVDGTAELLRGVEEFQGYLKEYTDGAAALKDGAKALRDGIGMLDSRKGDLETGAKALQSGLEQIQAALAAMGTETTGTESIEQLPADQTVATPSQIGPSQSQVQAALAEKIAQIELPDSLTPEQKIAVQQSIAEFVLKELGRMNTGADMAGALKELQGGIGQLCEGSKQLSDGIAAFNQGIGQLYDGSAQLYDGTKELSSAGEELYDGFGEAADGVKSLKDGMEEFDREGIQELSKLAGPKLEELLERLKELKAADKGYQSFSGLLDGKTGSVKFVIETEEI